MLDLGIVTRINQVLHKIREKHYHLTRTVVSCLLLKNYKGPPRIESHEFLFLVLKTVVILTLTSLHSTSRKQKRAHARTRAHTRTQCKT